MTSKRPKSGAKKSAAGEAASREPATGKAAKKAAAKRRPGARRPPRFASKFASKFAADSLACSAAVWCRTGVRGGDLDKFLAAKEELSDQLLRPRAGAGVGMASLAPSPSPENNVVGVCIGEKLSGGRHTGVMTLQFLVRVKYGAGQVTSSDCLPQSVRGMPTDVEEVGTIRCAQAATPDPRAMLRPAPPGASVGFRDPADPPTAGTLGALARNGARRFILSNNHVLVPASQRNSAVGTPIFQPAPFDAAGSPGNSRVGTLTSFVRLHANRPNLVDCAIAELDSPSLVTNSIMGIGAPRGVGVAQADAPVEKFGRTTRFSVGTIASTNAEVLVRYPGIGTLLFQNQIMIRGRNGLPFSSEGDSGALIIERTTGRAVGLLFAVTPNGVFANHIGDVLQALSVSLA